ncbi:Cysteine-rich receptor-like protein kinase 25 [Linum grandiflorum]
MATEVRRRRRIRFIISLTIFTLTIHLLPSTITSQPPRQPPPPTLTRVNCLDGSNSTTPKSYTSNLSSLLNSFPSNSSTFSNASSADGDIHALYLCRGDVLMDVCTACVRQAVQRIQQTCPNHRSALVWYDECMLRYSNASFFGEVQISPNLVIGNTQNTASPDEPNNGALALIYALIDYVPYTRLMYGTNESEIRGQNRYAMAQCTRDLSSRDCNRCLGQLNDASTRCCQGRIGWRILTPSCSLRYEQTRFYRLPEPPPESPLPPPPPAGNDNVGGEEGSNNNTGKIVGITVSAIVLVLLAMIGTWYCSCFRKRRGGRSGETGHSEEILLPDFNGSSHNGAVRIEGHENDREVHVYTLAAIQAATNSFSDRNKLGQGGFGPVYKGKLPDGQEIAVKRLSLTSKQGLEEFRNEVMVIVKLQHKNLVRLLGYCLERGEKLLVYEYLANTSLDAFLFGSFSFRFEIGRKVRSLIGRGEPILSKGRRGD